MSEWDGKWWAESFDRWSGDWPSRYQELIARLGVPHDKAREIFQLGHEHGYDLARELSRED